MNRLWFTVQPLLALAAATPLLAQGFAFETKQQDPSRYRPPGLKILSQRAVPYGEEVLGVTEDLSTALEVARCMAENDQRVVLIQAL